eukprot:scaffold163823_cov28-Prasinocladus_malaysianus.AAC.2
MHAESNVSPLPQDAEAAHRLKPDEPRALLHLGRALFLLEEYLAAKQAYTKGLELNPNDQLIQIGLLGCPQQSQFEFALTVNANE